MHALQLFSVFNWSIDKSPMTIQVGKQYYVLSHIVTLNGSVIIIAYGESKIYTFTENKTNVLSVYKS